MTAKYKLHHPEAVRVHALLAGALHTTVAATFQAKYQFLQPRPTALDPSLTLPTGFGVPAHPSVVFRSSASWSATKSMLTHSSPEVATSRLAGYGALAPLLAPSAQLQSLRATPNLRSA